MNEQGKSQAEMESMLQRFALTEFSSGQRQRVLETARNAWQETSILPARSKLRFARALAACMLVIFAVDVCGRLALAPWRPHPASQTAHQSNLSMEDFHKLVPSAKLYHGMTHSLFRAKKTGLQDYRNHLNRLLDETPQRQVPKHTAPKRYQGWYVPTRPASWHS